MARRLGMLKSQGIKALGEAGRPKREFAQVMGVSRGAVRRHLGREEANRTKACTDAEEPNGTKTPTGSTPNSPPGIDMPQPNCCHLKVQTGATRQLHVRPQIGATRQSKPDELVPPVS